MILNEVINRYQEQGLTNLAGNYEDCNFSFSFSSLKSIHGYLDRLPHHLFSRYKKIYPLFDAPGPPRTKFNYDELNYIESISKNNGKFEVSLEEYIRPQNEKNSPDPIRLAAVCWWCSK